MGQKMCMGQKMFMYAASSWPHDSLATMSLDLSVIFVYSLGIYVYDVTVQ